jgi:hypothetical protein
MAYWDHLDSREVECISGACMMIDKKTFEEVGGFDKDYLFYTEDLDLCYKIQKYKKRIFYCSEAKVTHYGKGSTNKVDSQNFIYEVILFFTLRQFFKKNRSMWIYFLFNFISSLASLFRILVIIFLGPVFGFKESSEFNIYNLKKYVWILFLSINSKKASSLRNIFSNAKTK